MKWIVNVALMISTLVILIVACELITDDDDMNVPDSAYYESFFEMDDNRVKLASACLINYGTDTETEDGFNYQGYYLRLLIGSRGINMTIDESGILQVSGEGLLLNFLLISERPNFEGSSYFRTLTYDDSTDPIPPGIVYYSSCNNNWSENGTGEWQSLSTQELRSYDDEGVLFLDFRGMQYDEAEGDLNDYTGQYCREILYVDYSSY